MDRTRRVLLVIIAPLLTVLLFATAMDWGVVKTVGNPQAVKQIVAESGVYNGVIPSLLTQVKQINTSAGTITLTDPATQQIANQAISPKFVQTNAEAAIDSIYAWLDGKTPQPNFQVNASGVKTDFANSLAAEIQAKAATLPVCKTPVVTTPFDISNATCLPRGTTAASLAQMVQTDVAGSNNGFLENANLSASDIKDPKTNQSVFVGKLKNVPRQYQMVKMTPYIFIGLTVLLVLAIVFLSFNRWRGLRRVGFTLLFIGIVMMAVAWSLDRASVSVIQPKITLNNTILQTDVRNLVADIIHRVDRNYWIFGIIYAVLGGIAIAVPRFVPGALDDQPEQKADKSDKPPADKPQAPPSPPKKKVIKVQ